MKILEESVRTSNFLRLALIFSDVPISNTHFFILKSILRVNMVLASQSAYFLIFHVSAPLKNTRNTSCIKTEKYKKYFLTCRDKALCQKATSIEKPVASYNNAAIT